MIAFRDRATGRNYNRSQPTEADDGDRPTRGRGRGRGGPRRDGDRHSRTGLTYERSTPTPSID